MSHWAKGKLNLKCSLAVLKRALINILPEWENYIRVDPEGRIPIYTYRGEKMQGKAFHIMIPGIANPHYDPAPGLRYNDVGLRQEADGSWTVEVDRSGMTKVKNLEGHITGEVARMKAKAIAQMEGNQILKDGFDGKDKVLQIRAPVKSKYKKARV